MPLIEELTSKRSPLVKKAAKKILKDRLKGYGPYLHSALEAEIEKKELGKLKCTCSTLWPQQIVQKKFPI